MLQPITLKVKFNQVNYSIDLGPYMQATNLAQTLKEVNFTDVYTSNYPRTIETASIVLSHNLNNKSPPTKTDERLREIVMHIMITSNFRNICVTIFCVFHKGIDNMYGQPYGTIFKALIAFLNSGRPLDEFAVQESEPLPEIRKRAGEFLVVLIKHSCDNLLQNYQLNK